MTLDNATKLIYRRTDSAALISLLPEIRRVLKAAQKEGERLAHQPAPDAENDRLVADLTGYITALSERERWIRNELKRRGLLPLWPGEEAHLDEDA